MIPGLTKAIASAMGNDQPIALPFRGSKTIAHGKPGKPGDKLRRRAAAGTLTMQNPGGLVSETFREKARERNLERMKARRGES